MSRERRGLRDGGDRTATIARWLASKSQAAFLVLVSRQQDDWIVNQRWEREEVSEALAQLISEQVQDLANEYGQQLTCRLQWVDEEERVVSTLPLRGRPDEESLELVAAMDGSNSGSLQQTQRHLEVCIQRMVQMTQIVSQSQSVAEERWGCVFSLQSDLLEKLVERVNATQERYETAKDERDQAIELANDAAKAAEVAKQDAKEAREQHEDKIAKVIEFGFKHLSAGASKPPATGGGTAPRSA